MLTIDLLKGQGIPIKSRPGGAALLAFSIAVPVIVGIILLGDYVRGRIILKTERQYIIKLERKITQLSEGINFQEKIKREIEDARNCLVEVAETIQQQVQWSSILETLVTKMPDTLAMAELDVESTMIRERVPRRDDPSKFISIPVPKRTLHIGFYRKLTGGTDEPAMKYLQGLIVSPALSEETESIRFISQTTNVNDDTMHYMIECIFKTYNTDAL